MSKYLIATVNRDIVLEMPRWFLWLFERFVTIDIYPTTEEFQGQNCNFIYFDEDGGNFE